MTPLAQGHKTNILAQNLFDFWLLFYSFCFSASLPPTRTLFISPLAQYTSIYSPLCFILLDSLCISIFHYPFPSSFLPSLPKLGKTAKIDCIPLNELILIWQTFMFYNLNVKCREVAHFIFCCFIKINVATYYIRKPWFISSITWSPLRGKKFLT